jgi:hypothetical protein
MPPQKETKPENSKVPAFIVDQVCILQEILTGCQYEQPIS